MYELKHFTNLVIRLNNPEIQTVDALLIRLVGDRVGGTMLKNLLYWMPKSVRSNGMVYKSWRHWMAECVLSIAQIKRVHHERLLEAVGIERQLKKADGAPTNHYKVNFSALLEKLATFLKVGVGEVVMWLQHEPPPKLAEKKVPKARATTSTSYADVHYVAPIYETLEQDTPTIQLMESRSEDEEGHETWQLTCRQLRGILERGLYDTFLQRTKCLSMDEASKVMTVETPNAYVTENLAGRLYPRVVRTFQDLAGSGWLLKFVTHPSI